MIVEYISREMARVIISGFAVHSSSNEGIVDNFACMVQISSTDADGRLLRAGNNNRIGKLDGSLDSWATCTECAIIGD
jgi:hypothetical protein